MLVEEKGKKTKQEIDLLFYLFELIKNKIIFFSAFSNPQSHHHMQRQPQANRSQSQWQQSFHDQQGFQPSMNDWGKQQQYRGTSKPPPSLNHPPPSHASFGSYRPYM
jgi:hypothetical protein